KHVSISISYSTWQSQRRILASVPVEQLIEKVDGFAAPEHKYNIVKKLQELKHICRMTGDGCSYFEESQYWYRSCY
ncbi:unnamed protein product, partial [Brassica oleracea var. botrytis]